MKITVRKIAEEAGVSPASVSRYINGSEDVSSEIASKVESALFSLGGSPVVRRPRKQIILILLTHLRFDFYGRTLAELLEQEPQAQRFYIVLVPVDLKVKRRELFCKLRVAREQRLCRVCYSLLAHCAHKRELFAKLLELGIEFASHQPNLPVI